MQIEERSALLVIDVQGGDMTSSWKAGMEEAEKLDRKMIVNAKKVLDVFRAKHLPVIQVKEVHRKNHVDFGRELDGSEGVHLLENDPHTGRIHDYQEKI